MKVAITTAVLLVLLGTTTSSYARQEKGQEEHSQGAKPAEQQHAQQQSKPAQQQHAQEQTKPVQQQHVKQQAKPAQQQHAQEQTKPAQQQHVKQQAKPAQQQHAQEQTKPAQQQHVKQQAKPVQQQHAEQGNAGKSQAQAQQSHPAGGNKGNYAHGRISDAHYAASFGSGHRFHISQATISIGASNMVATRSGLSIPGRSVGATRTTFTSCTSMAVITCTTRFIPGCASRSAFFRAFSATASGKCGWKSSRGKFGK